MYLYIYIEYIYIYIIYLEPNWPLFLKVHPLKQGPNFNQNKGPHLGSRYIHICHLHHFTTETWLKWMMNSWTLKLCQVVWWIWVIHNAFFLLCFPFCLQLINMKPKQVNSYLECIKIYVRQLWLVLRVKLMGINTNLFSQLPTILGLRTHPFNVLWLHLFLFIIAWYWTCWDAKDLLVELPAWHKPFMIYFGGVSSHIANEQLRGPARTLEMNMWFFHHLATT